jgi:hypothetical protein
MCFLQQLWGNVVFGAKKSITCGLVQKSHQHVVLPAISSSESDEDGFGSDVQPMSCRKKNKNISTLLPIENNCR